MRTINDRKLTVNSNFKKLTDIKENQNTDYIKALTLYHVNQDEDQAIEILKNLSEHGHDDASFFSWAFIKRCKKAA